MPTFGHHPNPIDGKIDHDWCLATTMCRRCGASQKAVAQGQRAEHCEPGVTGISWARRAERMRDMMAPWGHGGGDNFRYAREIDCRPAPSHEVKTLPLYRMSDLGPPQHPMCRSGLTGKRADLVIIDDPEGPSAA